ncbi:DNA helicase [Tanacetum coccineum]
MGLEPVSAANECSTSGTEQIVESSRLQTATSDESPPNRRTSRRSLAHDILPSTPDPPIFIQQLVTNSQFMKHIKAYNQMFAMTSFGAKVDDSVNWGRGPYVFKVSGEIPSFKIRLYNKGGARGYELLTSNVLGGIVFEDGPKSRTDFDVIIEFYPKLVLKHRDGSGGRLFQQYVVAAFCAVEQTRLNFIRKRQNDLRSDYLLGPNRILRKIDRSIEDASTSTGERHIQILNVHLENMQRVNFCERDWLDVIVNMPDRKKTTLIESWHRRVVRTKKSLGRLTYVHPNSSDLFYFRMLLFHQKGCKSPIEVRTVNGQILPTYRAACEALDPPKLWRKHQEAMQHDIPAKISETTGILNHHVNTPELQDHILYELETILNGFGKSVKEFGLPSPPERLLKDLKNKLLMEEKNYKRDTLMQETALFVPKLNQDQKEIYDLIINASEESRQELLFVYGHGGTGKTFLWKTIISSPRSQGKIVLAVASSGIASLLLPAGRIAHSKFKLPLELTNETLRDLMNAPETLFGGKTVVLGGDFWQTLIVKKGAAKQELIHASIAETYLWVHFRICTLKQNMRLLRSAISDDEWERSKVFAKWLLIVGNGEVGEPDKDNNEDTSWITVPQQYCINPSEHALLELINFIYDDATLKTPTASAFQEKAIVCPKNDTANAINAKILSLVEAKGGITNYVALKCESVRRLMPFIAMSGTTIASLKVGQEDCVIEAKVYRKWTSKSILEFKEQAFCCILIDRELPSRVPYQDEEDSKTIYPILAGCIRSISDITPFRDETDGQKYRSKVDIESLEGNLVEFTMWDDLATQFNKQEIEKLPPPIIIVVSSCRVSKYRDVQLSATPATHYYINPKTQKAENAYAMFKEKYSLNPPLQVTKYRYDDLEQEKTRNRQTLYTLLQQNPTTFKGVRFTRDAMITSLNNKRSWNYVSCSQCNKASIKRNGINTCEDHGEHEPPTYRYNFKATVADETATVEFTFFTTAGKKITGYPCSHLRQATDKS